MDSLCQLSKDINVYKTSFFFLVFYIKKKKKTGYPDSVEKARRVWAKANRNRMHQTVETKAASQWRSVRSQRSKRKVSVSSDEAVCKQEKKKKKIRSTEKKSLLDSNNVTIKMKKSSDAEAVMFIFRVFFFFFVFVLVFLYFFWLFFLVK